MTASARVPDSLSRGAAVLPCFCLSPHLSTQT